MVGGDKSGAVDPFFPRESERPVKVQWKRGATCLDVVFEVLLEDMLNVVWLEDADEPSHAGHTELEGLEARDDRSAVELRMSGARRC